MNNYRDDDYISKAMDSTAYIIKKSFVFVLLAIGWMLIVLTLVLCVFHPDFQPMGVFLLCLLALFGGCYLYHRVKRNPHA